mmetsp:Transcript_2789/g.2321  ORF Transcript_2789/g.2321 Transcript_2789/m.2321 type:complete len:124 (+) Transcript_2789:433-804(+)
MLKCLILKMNITELLRSWEKELLAYLSLSFNANRYDEEVYQRKYLINHARIGHYLHPLHLFENNNFQIDNLKMYLSTKHLPKFKLSESITNSVKDFDIKFYAGIVDRSDEDNILSLLSYCQES